MASHDQEQEIERLRRKNRLLSAKLKQNEQPKTLRRILLEAIFGGSLVTASVAGGYKVYESYENRNEAVCERAHAAILDDRLNGDIAQSDREAYMKRQVRIAKMCDQGKQ